MTTSAPRYPRYQDYVIRDGALVGEFEQMYQDHEDPWQQTTREEWASEKAVALNLIKKVGASKVIEIGCGLGHYTNSIAGLGVDVLGIDISETAITKARRNYPGGNFAVADILDFDIYRTFKPDVIVMAEITWYVLERLDDFLEFVRTECPETYLIHLLTTYPEGVQKYGTDKFTTLTEIMSYFGGRYLEWGEITYPELEGCIRTYFVAQLALSPNRLPPTGQRPAAEPDAPPPAAIHAGGGTR